MPSFTKKAILSSFLYLLGKKPFDKITVRDIVDDCGINRNTFYYYFQDIYAVLEELCASLLSSLPQDASLSDTLGAFFATFVDFSEKYPRSMHSLALGLGYEGMDRYFAAGLDEKIDACLVRGGVFGVSRENPDLIVLLRHALLGFCLDFARDEKHTGGEARIAGLREALMLLLPRGVQTDLLK